jgi:acyl-CoA reductase-like NAD-dependent aldehyde dehydrogenase
VKNPSTGGIVGQAQDASIQDLDRAVHAANVAFEKWSKLSSDDLKTYCQKVTEKITEYAEEIAVLITQEQGKPLNGLGSRWEMGGAAAWAGYTSDLELPVKILQDNEEGLIELHRKPIGVIGSITPWNFPVLIAVWHILPALRSGNTVVVKPSPYTPLSTIRLVEIMNMVLPKGVVNCITSSDKNDNIGKAMSEHPDIRKIVFTGSCATGQKIMESAAPTMKRLTLEMGGNDAGIILPDVDVKAIAEPLFWGAFINNGQTCAALKRLYIHEDVHDAVCEALVDFAKNIPVGDGMSEESILGPVQNTMQFETVSRLVAEGQSEGRVLLGGEPKGLFHPITIIDGLSQDNALIKEEQFGPALGIVKYSKLEDAIKMANDSENGLGGSVWSSDIQAAKSVASLLECGSVWINKHGAIQPNAPFGGVKKSGLGVEFAEEGLHEYTDIQVVFS